MGTSLNGLTPAGTYPGLIKTGDNAPIDGTLKTLSDGNGNNLPMEASTTGINFTGTAQVGGVAIANTTQVAAKQDLLVSGTNIKTINGASVLGSGNIAVVTSPSGVAGAIQFSNGSAFASDAANLFWDDTNNRLGIGTNTPIATTTVNASGTWISGFSNNLRLNGSSPSLQLKTDAGDGGFMIATSGLVTYFSKSENSSFTSQTYIGNIAAGGNWNFGTASNLSATVGVKGSGSTSATTSLLVQNSAGNNALKVVDDRSVGMYAFSQLCMNSNADTNTNGSLRFLVLSSSGNSYIDGWSDGTAKAQNYPLVIGSRVGNLGSSLTGNTTTENGTPVIFGFEVAQASALVTMNSTTRGFLPPRMTTTQKTNISSPAAGLVVYDSTTNKLCCYNGSTWNDLF